MQDRDSNISNILSSGLLAQLELPQVGRKFPVGYHEAYWFYGYDAAQSIGYYFYLVADTNHDTLRHEHTYLYLPDGSILAGYGAGDRTHPSTACGDHLEFHCEIPFTRWQVRYQTQMTLIAADRRLEGPLQDQQIAVDVALSFEALTPTWNTEGDWGEPPPALRYHQLGRGSGTVTWGDRSLTIDGNCFRSHSRRQREMAGWSGHTLANGLFASGRAFGIFRMRGSEQRPERGRGFVINNGQLFDADVLSYPKLETPTAQSESFEIVLRGDFGTITVRGETVTEAFLSQSANGRRYGVEWDAAAGMVLADGFARYHWGDEATIGVIERSALPSALQRLP